MLQKHNGMFLIFAEKSQVQLQIVNTWYHVHLNMVIAVLKSRVAHVRCLSSVSDRREPVLQTYNRCIRRHLIVAHVDGSVCI